MQYRYFHGIVALTLLATSLLWSCGDQPTEKSKPLVVSQKISDKDKPKPKPEAVADTKQEEALAKDIADTEAAEEVIASKRIYDPANRLNPFIPLFKPDQEKNSAALPNTSKRKKRVPQTPLERISLEQLHLRAVIRAPSGNRALVEDNSGKGYIIKNGTYIGLNSGIVTQINAESIVIEEEIENLMGELVLQNTEIKLQKKTGE
ncbi:PilP: type IV pilus assembly protein, PilP [Desulfosarcina variabilis str. Montpellier]|uniref:pilus assembly protein PilP n=1 Tax=Desulfosarcina variabilis TaxID=2300 RepID=UPI003AFABB5D